MKIITVIGARPQFIKAATVSRAILKYNSLNLGKSIQEIIIHTGQHYDSNMSDVFFETMEIPKPDYLLGIGGETHGVMTGRQIEKIESILIKEKPDYLLVYGDTNSTFSGALAASKQHIPVIHVEAGLRSFNKSMPEEINRILTDNISDLLFCPTRTAVNNLFNEGFENKGGKIFEVGDVMLDASLYYLNKAIPPKDLELKNSFILVTFHRAENTDDLKRLKEIVDALNELSKTNDIVLPLHPRTKKAIFDAGFELKVKTIEPVGYFEMLWLLSNCQLVITDSGGVQKEAYFFNKGCVTLREQTEWTELVSANVNVLTAIDVDDILNAVTYIKKLKIPELKRSGFYGSGDAASKIVNVIVRDFCR